MPAAAASATASVAGAVVEGVVAVGAVGVAGVVGVVAAPGTTEAAVVDVSVEVSEFLPDIRVITMKPTTSARTASTPTWTTGLSLIAFLTPSPNQLRRLRRLTCPCRDKVVASHTGACKKAPTCRRRPA